MTSYMISLDELDRVKRVHGISSVVQLSEATRISRNTWSSALKSRRPTPQILDALAQLGARPSKVLVAAEPTAQSSAA